MCLNGTNCTMETYAYLFNSLKLNWGNKQSKDTVDQRFQSKKGQIIRETLSITTEFLDTTNHLKNFPFQFNLKMKLNKILKHICHFFTHLELVVHLIYLQMARNNRKLSLTNRSRGFPSLKRMNVGNASILYLSAMAGYFSVSILTTWTLSIRVALTCSRIGTMN